MSKFAIRVKGWYEANIWTETMVMNVYNKGKLTEEEMRWILGEDD